MTCQEFLSRHSDFLDGPADDAIDARCRAHLSGCSACARHHRIVKRSLELLSDVPVVRPSSDFQDRLQHRLMHLQDELARHDRFAGSGTMASLAIAAVMALVAWGPLMWPDGVRDIDAPVAVARDAGRGGTPLTGMASIEWYGVAPGTASQDGPPSLSAAFPGPYSPLIVEAPVTRASQRVARAVFAAYYPGVE